MLWTREVLEPIEHRRTHLLKGGERELHLRLDADSPHEPKVLGRPDQVVQQRRLAYARLPAEHERAALTRAHCLEQLVERGALRGAPSQGDRDGHRPTAKPTSRQPPFQSARPRD